MNRIRRLVSSSLLCLAIATPVAQANTMLGSYIKHDGWSTYDIDQFNEATNKSMAVQNLFVNFNIHWNYLNIQASNIVSRGAVPMISLMPKGSRNSDTLAAIVAGDEDDFLEGWISSFQAWRNSYPEGERPVILLRFGHEFNGNWYPWGNRPEVFKAAWRHIHAKFESAGANDGVEWVWCASATDVDDYDDVSVYYPGDDVVDWTGIDGYNWGSNYSWSVWRSFDQVFSHAYDRMVENYPDKPVILAEVATAEPSDVPDVSWGQFGNNSDANESKDLWIQDMMNRIESDYPAIRAIAWFNRNKEVSWALNGIAKTGEPNTGLFGYNVGVDSDHFSGDFVRLGADFPGQQVADASPVTAEGFYQRMLDILIPAANAAADKKGDKKRAKAKRKLKKRAINKLRKKQVKKRFRALQRKLALSKRAKVVGKRERKKEADGRRKMAKQYRNKMAESRMKIR